jgi:hypothetical protein
LELVVTEIFREVDEELRRDNWQKLWRRYGKYAIAFVVLIVAATALNVGWRDYQLRQQRSSSDAFLAALELAKSDRIPEALSEFAVLKEEGAGGYSILAEFRQAALRSENGEIDTAIEIYDRIAEDYSQDDLLSELATLYSVILQSESGDAASLIARLESVAGDGRPWRYSAREAIAVLNIRLGEMAKAREAFTALVDDLEAPRNMRARAAEMLRVLDS